MPQTYNEKFHPEIVKVYREAGIPAPYGRGIHTLAFHKLAVRYMKQGLSKDEAYKRTMDELGAEKAVNPSHRKGALKRYAKLRRKK